MSRLSGFPQGFLSLLGSQNFGEAPKELAEFVQPTIEMLELYLLGNQRLQAWVSNDTSAPTITDVSGAIYYTNPNNNMVVPAGQMWRVHLFGVQMQTGAGEAVNFSPAIAVNNLAMPLGDGPRVLGASASSWQRAEGCPFWLRSGDSLGVWQTGIVGAPNGQAYAVVSVLRA